MAIVELFASHVPQRLQILSSGDGLEGSFSKRFCKFSGPKNCEKSIFLVPVTIVDLFASHVPWRMQILSSGDGLEGHFQSVFENFSTNFQQFFHKLGVPSVDLAPQTISEALPAAKRANYFRR